MDQLRCSGTMLLCLTALLTYTVTVSALDCYSCNSLGVGDSHSNDACEEFDKSKIGTEPCQIPDGKVGKCQVFKGSVTVDPPLLDPQTAAGSYRSCAVFDMNSVPQDGCYAAEEIPSDVLGTVFSAFSFFGLDEAVNGITCYCSNDRCSISNGITGSTPTPEVAGSTLECYSCNSLGVGDSHTNDACVKFDESQIGTEPCQIPEGKVGKCQVFKGSVTVDPPIFDPQTAAGSYRSCEVFERNSVPQDGCYDAEEIPTDVLGTVFSISSFLGLNEAVNGTKCYCSRDRCNVLNMVTSSTAGRDTNGAQVGRSNGVAGTIRSHVNVMLLFMVCLVFMWSM